MRFFDEETGGKASKETIFIDIAILFRRVLFIS